MSVNLEAEERQYQAEVAAVKKWWTDSRWRQTKRPFTAEQIVAKRGNLTIEYPSNAQSKKLWNIVEGRFKVCICARFWGAAANSNTRIGRPATHTAAWTQSWLRKWPNTSTRCTFLAGSALPQHRPATSQARISQITPWWALDPYNRLSHANACPDHCA
jgi:hypothetical protein